MSNPMSNLPAVLGLDVPNLLPSVLRPAGRLIWSSLALLIVTGVLFRLAKRPKSPEPTTWAASILGAVGTFALMILAYGTIPHEWLTFANSHLDWGTNSFLVQDSSVIPFDITYAALKDAIAAGIYIVFLVVNAKLIVAWQGRPVREPGDDGATARDAKPTATSAYGRPVTAER